MFDGNVIAILSLSIFKTWQLTLLSFSQESSNLRNSFQRFHGGMGRKGWLYILKISPVCSLIIISTSNDLRFVPLHGSNNIHDLI